MASHHHSYAASYGAYPYNNNCPPPPQHQHYGVPQQQLQNQSNQMFMNYPLKGIPHPHAHDVLCGRGGQSNSHPGNMQWRTLVAANKELYVSLPKKQKMLLSQSIVNAVRSQHPPGRFLGKDNGAESSWHDVGDKRAQEKTSQALREGAPGIRKNLKEKETTPKNETKEKPFKTESLERCPSREQMPPPSITIVPPPASFAQQPALSPTSMTAPPQREEQPRSDVKLVPDTHHSNPAPAPPLLKSPTEDYAMPPPPTQINEGELSFGSFGLMSDTEQAKLMHGFSIGSATHHMVEATIPESAQYPNQDMPLPVDGGLEPVGFSFGSVMSMGTNPLPANGNLEGGGLSFGSTMSYSVCKDATSTRPINEYSGAPDLHDIGTSFGSLSLAPGERERIIKEAHHEMETAFATAPPTTFLKQQRSKGDLLDCEDSDDEEDSAQASVQRTMEWEKLQTALATQKSSGSIAPPFFPSRTEGPPTTLFHMPAQTDGITRDFSNVSAISVSDNYPQPSYSQNESGDDDPLPFQTVMPPPPAVMKKSENWAGEELKMGYRF